VEVVDGEEKYFCCNGCKSVYFILQGEGFAKFYDKRDDTWEPGPNDFLNVSEELFIDKVREVDDELEIQVMLSGIRCASCVWLVENFLLKQDGITYVRVNYATHKARIRWKKDAQTSLKKILNYVTSIGYSPLPINDAEGTVFEKERKDYFYRFSIAAFFAMNIMIYSVALYAGYFHGMDEKLKSMLQYIAWILATPVMFYSGWPFLINSIKALKSRNLTMDSLVFLGSFSAYSYSIGALLTGREIYFDTSSMIVTLILLGRFIEAGAKVRTSNAVTKLLSYQPDQVRLIKDFDQEKYDKGIVEAELVHIKSIKTGEYLEVLPGGAIPADGVVVYGSSEVDESMLTGEQSPQFKEKNSSVFAGTGNVNGRLVIRADKLGKDTVLSKIVTAVEDAQNEKAPIQNIADKVVGWFVPLIIIIAAGTYALWSFYSHDQIHAIMNAISVLVIACPCALGLATPLAILVSTSKIASSGAVVKSGETVEIMSRVNCYCFDKTGTITMGEMNVNEIIPFGIEKERLAQIAASAEKGSSHIISKAVVEHFTGDFLPISDFQEHPGKGITADVGDKKVVIGNIRFIKNENINISGEVMNKHDELSSNGFTVIAVGVNGRFSGLITLNDSIREEAAEMISNLISAGKTVKILTGDNEKAAVKTVERLGVKGVEIIAEVTPFDKAEVVKKLQNEGFKVAMVGDGINDALALTQADIGIGMGKGTDIAIESSDAVLVKNRLEAVYSLDRIANKTLSVIKQNLFWAFSYNFVTVPLAASGKIHPIVSAAFMAVSSLFVVFNSLRINRVK